MLLIFLTAIISGAAIGWRYRVGYIAAAMLITFVAGLLLTSPIHTFIAIIGLQIGYCIGIYSYFLSLPDAERDWRRSRTGR